MPTRVAGIAFIGAALMVLLGIAVSSPIIVSLGGTGFAALGFALALTMPTGRRVRHEKLEFAWWLAHGDGASAGGAVTPGAPFTVRCYIRHRGHVPLFLSQMKPIVPGGARLLQDEPDSLMLMPATRTEFAFRLLAPAAGRVVLHGLAVTLVGPLGLFEVPLYFPNPLAIKVLPSAAAIRHASQRSLAGLPLERSGTTRVRRPGGGTELRELRELHSGDPFKSIAWKASARAGKLLVREVEREVQDVHYVIVDVSGTMRGGALGRRKLDFAIEAATVEARRTLERGDEFGLITVDGRILHHVPADDGVRHMIRVYDALIGCTEVVDHDLTDLDDDEVVATVGRYVRNQDGIDFSSTTKPDAWEVGPLIQHVSRSLGKEGSKEQVLALSPTSTLLRRFCKVRGIPLPYRPDPRDASKAPGLAHALREAEGRSRVPRSILLITDLDSLGAPEPLVAAVKLMRIHGHSITLFVLDARHFVDAPSNVVEADLYRVYGHGEDRRL
ncbi:MAG: DUF58 domain-containing protein [Sandaracinaceae bacterium]|nr:DUF58 domain-containing protein [Sandaracinaceae bacterium]